MKQNVNHFLKQILIIEIYLMALATENLNLNFFLK